MQRTLGVNTWVWVSPLTDEHLPALLAKIAAMGFGAVELPVEAEGDWDPYLARDLLQQHGLTAYVCGAMGPGRDLLRQDRVRPTQDYLRHCIAVAQILGSPGVSGPFYSETGRTWRLDDGERANAYAQLQRALIPLADLAGDAGIRLAIEPLNRYETSLINTVQQALDALGPLLGPPLGLMLDSYHLNIEEKDPFAAIRAAGEHLAVVQVCGNDRGAVGDDHIDWSAFLDALDDARYAGPLNIESFTAENETIAVAASIWRPLAPSQDALAERSLNALTALQQQRG
jgi:D-psicose/D-tagatose/L-ribulose 3-epimerase